MTWFDTALSDEQSEVIALIQSVLAALPDLETHPRGPDDAAAVAEARAALVDSGAWSIGIDEGLGGGGAPLLLRQTALVALGGHQPALAWAAAQAHAAAEVLAAATEHTALLAAIVAGDQPVCVMDADADAVRLTFTAGTASGQLGRLDPAGTAPAVIVLDGADAAWVLPPETLDSAAPLARSGLAGARTMSAHVAAAGVARLGGVPAARARASLQIAAAAIAAGLAVAAAEAAMAYSRERTQFGGPLTGLAAVRSALVEQTARAAAVVADSLVAEVPASARSAALLRGACEGAIDVAASAVQSHGGYGYLREYGVERLVRDAVSLRAATGAAIAMRRSAAALAPEEVSP